VLAPFVLAGCIAGIQEERAYGPAHPASADGERVDVERREGDKGPECRSVTSTPMVREVDLRRSFTSGGPLGAQATNLGLATLFGAAAVLVGYDLSTLACAQNHNTGCSGQTQAGADHAEALAIGLALVPTVFLVINALRVQDARYTESVQPEVARTEWVPCGP
jgi:hypothetical protein